MYPIPAADILGRKAYIGALPTARDPMSADRLKRLIYRSSYTGTKELDLVLGGFARTRLAGLDSAQLARYEALVDAENPEIYAWVIQCETPPAEHDTDVLRMIRDYARASRV